MSHRLGRHVESMIAADRFRDTSASLATPSTSTTERVARRKLGFERIGAAYTRAARSGTRELAGTKDLVDSINGQLRSLLLMRCPLRLAMMCSERGERKRFPAWLSDVGADRSGCSVAGLSCCCGVRAGSLRRQSASLGHMRCSTTSLRRTAPGWCARDERPQPRRRICTDREVEVAAQ
jgi:hypothetical protein